MVSHAYPAIQFEEASNALRELRNVLRRNVFGQEALIDEVVCALAADGHLLMTGAPGLAKTTLVRNLANAVSLPFKRIQFTPDLLPSDITGAEILNIDPATGIRDFKFVRGPVFGALLLADEINRASPRTQSALLEAMQERSVTVAGVTHQLPRPFLVFATQNPFESEGVFPLPEAQLDRFLMHSQVDYPSEGAELAMLEQHSQLRSGGQSADRTGSTDQNVTTADGTGVVLDSEVCQGVIDCAARIVIDESLLKGIVTLVRMTRPDQHGDGDDFISSALFYGAGPRSALALMAASRGLALLEGAPSVQWRHIERFTKPVLRHRIRLSMAAIRDGLTEDAIIDRLLERCRQTLKQEILAT